MCPKPGVELWQLLSSPLLTVGSPARTTKSGKVSVLLNSRLQRSGSAPFGRGRFSSLPSQKALPGTRAKSSTDRNSWRYGAGNAMLAAKAPAAEPTGQVEAQPSMMVRLAKGPRFHLELKRVTGEVGEVRQRQLSTRFRLDDYRQQSAAFAASSQNDDPDDGAFRRDLEAVTTEVGAMLADFAQEWQVLQPVNDELEDLAREADALVDTDLRMGELLSKMSSKLDLFEGTLGSARR